jgi:hypothetical protein
MILPKVRDPRFITVRRGGSLRDDDHRRLAIWAADCAAHVLQHFEEARPADDRPRRAIDLGRAWARGDVSWAEARTAAGHANAAARELRGAGRFAAYAAGQAAAVGHVAAHELGAAAYAVRAARAAAPAGESEAAGPVECRWQRAQLPAEIRELVLDDQRLRNELCWFAFDCRDRCRLDAAGENLRGRAATRGGAPMRGRALPAPADPPELDGRAAIHHHGQPARGRDPGRFPADDAELEPEARRARFDRLAGVDGAQLGTAEDVDDVERTGGGDGIGERREGGHLGDLALVRVDRNDVVPGADERLEDAVRRPPRVRGGADHRDPPGRAEHLRDPGVVQDRHRVASLVEVHQVTHPGAIGALGLMRVCAPALVVGRGQLAPSLT